MCVGVNNFSHKGIVDKRPKRMNKTLNALRKKVFKRNISVKIHKEDEKIFLHRYSYFFVPLK